MNPYTMTATCDVCGCEGAATPKISASAWIKGSFISHSDPRICAENLRMKRLELEERGKELKK